MAVIGLNHNINQSRGAVSVSHRDEVEDLIRKGRDTERLALARALRLHLRRQVMVYRGRTAVFA